MHCDAPLPDGVVPPRTERQLEVVMQEAPTPFVSVILPCRNESRYIARCLDSVFANDYPSGAFEVLVADGRSDDGTREILDDYARMHPNLKVLDNPQRITPCALNTAIRAARGEIIVRVDAHVLYPATYIRQLVDALIETGAESVGGVIRTIPAADTAMARAVAIGMSHPFGFGDSHFRIGSSVRREVDHVPFFCCRRTVFDRIGLFDEELVRNQDGEFSWRLRASGGRIMLIPEISSSYFARDTIGKLARMMFQYGYFKPLTIRKIGRAVTARQFAPSLLVLSLALSLSASPWSGTARLAFAGVSIAYIAAVLMAAGRTLRTHPPTVAGALLAVFPAMHFSYGYGFVRRWVELAVGAKQEQRDRALVPLTR